jgi:CxxC motif-containing protein
MIRNLTCIVCPKGCDLCVELEDKQVKSVTGHTCKRGLEYANAECTHPTRMLTTTVALKNGGVIAVRTEKPIPKELMFEAMSKINSTVASCETKIGDIIIENLLNTGVNVIASQNAR